MAPNWIVAQIGQRECAFSSYGVEKRAITDPREIIVTAPDFSTAGEHLSPD